MSNQDIGLYANDLLIQNGDLVIAASDNQHIVDTINAFPGWWKENPADGVGIFQYQNSLSKEQDIKRSITIQLIADGYNVANPDVSTDSTGALIINPNASK
jgi:hypothetical protein